MRLLIPSIAGALCLAANAAARGVRAGEVHGTTMNKQQRPSSYQWGTPAASATERASMVGLKAVTTQSAFTWLNMFTDGMDWHTAYIVADGNVNGGELTFERITVNQASPTNACPASNQPRVVISAVEDAWGVSIGNRCSGQDSCGGFEDCTIDEDDLPVVIYTEPENKGMPPLLYFLVATSTAWPNIITDSINPVPVSKNATDMRQVVQRATRRGEQIFGRPSLSTRLGLGPTTSLKAPMPYDHLFFAFSHAYGLTITDMAATSIALSNVWDTLDHEFMFSCSLDIPNFTANLTISDNSDCTAPFASAPFPGNPTVATASYPGAGTLYVCIQPSGQGFNNTAYPINDCEVSCEHTWWPHL